MYGDLMVLFEFFMVYLEDGDNPGSAHKFVVAHDPKPAEFKCWLVADPTWNFD